MPTVTPIADRPARSEPIGLLAGSGQLPFLTAEGIRRAGHPVATVGFRGAVDVGLAELSDRFALVGMTRWSTVLRLLRRWRVRQAVMIGGVAKMDMYSPVRLLQYLPDVFTAKLWFRTLREDHRDAAVLGVVRDVLAGEGVELMDSTTFCRDHLADEGVMTRVVPSDAQWADARFGWRIARGSAELDIGQCIAVKEGDIIAVEAIEGTDRMIERAGQLCRSGGWVLVKVARPNQDMRFDVPTVGPGTLRKLKACGGVCLVVEARRTLIVDKPRTLDMADKLRIPVIGIC